MEAGLLQHFQTGLFIGYDGALANDVALCLTKSGGTPQTFLWDNRCLLHIESCMYVHPAGGEAMQDGLLCLHPDGAQDRIAFRIDGNGQLIHMQSALAVHPFKGKAKPGVQLCLHPDREDHSRYRFVSFSHVPIPPFIRVQFVQAHNFPQKETVSLKAKFSASNISRDIAQITSPVMALNASMVVPKLEAPEDMTVEAIIPRRLQSDTCVGTATRSTARDLDAGLQWISFGDNGGRIEYSLSTIGAQNDKLFRVHGFAVHQSVSVGTLLGEDSSAFCVYELDMFHVYDCFNELRQHWNTSYPAAQKIFGDNPASKAIKGLISAEHSTLYREGASGRTVRGILQSGQNILELLSFGRREGRLRMFTYVLMDNTLRFSETGTQFLKDMMSKHALHANTSETVRYSGEFFIRTDEQQRYTLVIDNNSGTYAPDKDHLPRLVKVFQMNFPDLQVVGLSITDPLFQKYKAEREAINASGAACISPK